MYCPKAEQVVDALEAPVIETVADGSHPPVMVILVSPDTRGFVDGEVRPSKAGATVSRIQVVEMAGEILVAKSV